MEISDIQILIGGKIEITFCCQPDMTDCLKIIIDKENMWQIAKYCQENLSFAAELRKNKH